MNLSVFLKQHQVHSIEELRDFLEFRHEGKFGAFWLSEEKGVCPALALFIHGDQACMFFLREEGDTGFHSLGFDPDNFEEEVDFVIDNYQMDSYPQAMVVPLSQAIMAFEEFYRTGAQPKTIRWYEV